jgi:Domain of unknown function (DUF309)
LERIRADLTRSGREDSNLRHSAPRPEWWGFHPETPLLSNIAATPKPRDAMMGISEQLERGRVAFNHGDYFRAHELWEDVWHELVGPERIVVQGLIQIAAGLHHLQQHRPRPAVSLLRKGLEKLSRSTPGPTIHLRVGPLARHVARVVAELAAPRSRMPAGTTFKL